jgi:uncharacterized protein YneF (UPF0154 family)
MLFKIKYLAIAVITIGIVAIVVGGVFIYQVILSIPLKKHRPLEILSGDIAAI